MSDSAVEILGTEVQITHLLAAAVALVLGLVFLTRGGGKAAGGSGADSGSGDDDDVAAAGGKKKRRRKKKKKKKKAPAVPVDVSASEGEPSTDSEAEASDSESDDEPAPPTAAPPASKGKGKKKKKKNKQNKGGGGGGGGGGAPQSKAAKAAARKAAAAQKATTGSFKPPSGYNPTPEDTRKRREREAKRQKEQAAGITTRAAAKAASQAGTITKHGIVGLSRPMTKEDRQGGGWSQVGGDKKKKKKAANSAQMAAATDPNSRVLVVPTGKLGLIIGAGGLTLRKIEAETGCTVSMPQAAADAKPQPKTRVTIRGDDEDALREAVACVSDLVNRGHSDLLYRGTGAKQSVFRLPSTLHHLLVGKGGATIRAIQDKSKCKVVLPSDKNSNKITIMGDPAGIKIVQAALKQIEHFCYCSLADPSLTHQEVEVSESELGYIIGFKGQTIKSIQGDTNTKIYTPGRGRKNRNVIVVGSGPNVARAVKQIHRNIEKNSY